MAFKKQYYFYIKFKNMTEEKLAEAKKFKEAIEKAEKDLHNSNL